MRVLIACEFSGTIRDAFAARGHDAWSCDILPSETPGNHIQGTILDHAVVNAGWDLMVAHPDCTFLTVSGARWMNIEWREEAQLSALHFVKALWRFPIKHIAIENPVSRLSSLWRGPDQIVQPNMFGVPETKAWCLWLKNLPKLVPTNQVEGREPRVWRMAPGPDRKKERSRTPRPVAAALADQWGAWIMQQRNEVVSDILTANRLSS